MRSKSSAFFIGQPEARVHVSDLVVHVSDLVFLPLQISLVFGFFFLAYFLIEMLSSLFCIIGGQSGYGPDCSKIADHFE